MDGLPIDLERQGLDGLVIAGVLLRIDPVQPGGSKIRLRAVACDGNGQPDQDRVQGRADKGLKRYFLTRAAASGRLTG
ncbi:MAG: hypothetical protein AB7I37_26225 [Pirellulales bacterium]